MSSDQQLINWKTAKQASSIVGGAVPGATVGFATHGGVGAALGSLISVAAWPSVKAFLIDVIEWALGGVRRVFNIPRIAPNPYGGQPDATIPDLKEVPTPASPDLPVARIPTAVG